jgi:hypothetical protein
MVLEIPVTVQPFEPQYPLAEYKSDRAEFPSPAAGRLTPLITAKGARLDSDPGIEALAGLVKPWIEQSSGRADIAVVDGDVGTAVGALGVPNANAEEITTRQAMAWMGWAAASGAAHGKRRGAAAGRFETWWVLATLAELDFPPEPSDFEEVLEDFVFHWWSDGDDEGWRLNLAITDTEIDRTWAITAIDAK